jgi:DNA helicase II / ATP-dependent DNA helicase PcrA
VELDDPRKAILAGDGHLLIRGGPGCGKTTIALLKALQILDTLDPEQRVLFLSFSRAAVRQIADRMQSTFDRVGRDKLEIRTFHSFFLDLVRSHGRLLTGTPPSFIAPDRERQLQADFDGDWREETHRLARQDSRYVFDGLAGTAATLLERSIAVRALYSDTYPVIIVDEFQDTNNDQWRAVRALSGTSTVICLADPDQRIFDYMEDVDETCITQMIEQLRPSFFDLSKDNYRSPSSGLLDYANAVLRNDSSQAVPDSITTAYYQAPVTCEVKVHKAVVVLRDHLEKVLGRTPTIAVFTTANSLIGRVSEAISTDTAAAGGTLPAVDHELYWDPELAAAAGYVVASIMEWPGLPRAEAVLKTLCAITDFYRINLLAVLVERGRRSRSLSEQSRHSSRMRQSRPRLPRSSSKPFTMASICPATP